MRSRMLVYFLIRVIYVRKLEILCHLATLPRMLESIYRQWFRTLSKRWASFLVLTLHLQENKAQDKTQEYQKLRSIPRELELVLRKVIVIVSFISNIIDDLTVTVFPINSLIMILLPSFEIQKAALFHQIQQCPQIKSIKFALLC